jgi:hypothetical protein
MAVAQTPRVAMMAGPPPGVRAIWVLQADNKLLMYDAAHFHQWQGFTLPAEARKTPEAISISRSGDVLFAYPPDGRSALRRWWSSNRHHPELVGGAWDKRPAAGGGYNILSAAPQVYFTSNGDRLFWFEHREERLNRGPDISRDARFLAWTTDLDGERPRPVAEFSFAPCKCGTGACEETCPQAVAWAPAEGVSDFFFVTRWVPGQTGSDFLETALYQDSGGTWTSRKLSHPVERFLDAADHGDIYIEAVSDAGCCGWENESDDTTTVIRGGVPATIFDERRRFQNNDYDVSFYTPTAALSPDFNRVAYTIEATVPPGAELRLASDGKPNAVELKAIRQSIAELPRVEVVALSAPDQVSLSLAKTELIGWLEPQQLLVLRNGELQVMNVNSGKLLPTGIKADAAKFVFLR